MATERIMKKTAKFFLTLAVISGMIAPLYAQSENDLRKENSTSIYPFEKSVSDYLKNERYNSDTPQKKGFSIIQLFKSKAFAAEENSDDERKKIREEWKEFLGLDVFYPYFKAKEIENYIQEKSAIKLFNMRGKAEFSKDSKQVKYIFKRSF